MSKKIDGLSNNTISKNILAKPCENYLNSSYKKSNEVEDGSIIPLNFIEIDDLREDENFNETTGCSHHILDEITTNDFNINAIIRKSDNKHKFLSNKQLKQFLSNSNIILKNELAKDEKKYHEFKQIVPSNVDQYNILIDKLKIYGRLTGVRVLDPTANSKIRGCTGCLYDVYIPPCSFAQGHEHIKIYDMHLANAVRRLFLRLVSHHDSWHPNRYLKAGQKMGSSLTWTI